MSDKRTDEKPELSFYQKYSPCVVAIETVDKHGDVGIGVAFHIGDGYLVSARHVFEDRSISAIYPHHSADITKESVRVFFPEDPNIDLALLETDFSLEYYMNKTIIMLGNQEAEKVDHVEIGGHLDDWIDDGLVLFDVVVMGYPPIPTSREHVLVAARGEVNAIIDPYVGSPHPLFIVSPIVRGGFSGGPVLTKDGWLLGVIVSSLVRDGTPPELGFGAAITVEPLWDLLVKHRVFPSSNAKLLYLMKGAFNLTDEDFPFTRETLQAWEDEWNALINPEQDGAEPSRGAAKQ